MRTFRMLLLLTLLGLAAPAAATPLDDALEATVDGRLQFEFPTREGVYGDGRSLVMRGFRWNADQDCCDLLEEGPAFALVRVRGGVVIDVDVRVGRAPRRARATEVRDLGAVNAAVAADFLLTLVEQARGGELEDAILGASIAEGFDDWSRVVAIARDDDRPGDARKAAVFWLGQAASEEAGRELVALVDDEDTELRLREHAIFSLSQRDADECLLPLTKVATTSPHPQLREQALFWLAQLDDPRVVDLFEEILLEQ